MRNILYVVVLLLISNHALAASGITYHGRIMRSSDNTPVTSQTTEFRIQIKSPGNEGCLFWEEFQTKDLSATAGVFTITIGDTDAPNRVPVTVINPLTGSQFTLLQVFSNKSPYPSGLTCDDASGTYTPATDHGRKFQVYFRENGTAPWETMPPATINFVPLAYNSTQLDGYRSNEFLKIAPSAVYTPLTSGQVNTLVDLIAGTNNQYLRPGVSTFTGDVTGTSTSTSVERIRGTNVVATAPTPGQILKYDGTNWVPSADDTGGSPGDASYLAKGIVQINTDQATSGLFISNGVLALPNLVTAGSAGSASSVPVIGYDTKGRITSVSQVTIDDATKLALTGGTMSGAINMGNNAITNASSVSATSFSARNLVLNDNDTNTATIRAPTDITTNYNLTLPTGAPQNGYVLSTDASGQLLWIPASSGSLTGVSSTNSYLTVDNTVPTTPALTVNVGTAANTVAAGNDARIVGALQAADYNSDVLPAASCTTAQTPYWFSVGGVWACQNINITVAGDVTGAQGSTVVERIRGTNVVATVPLNGQVLKFDGTNYVPSADAGLTVETDPTVAAWAKAAPNSVFTTVGDVLNVTSRIPSSSVAPTAGQSGQSLRWNEGAFQWEWFTPGVAGSGFSQGGNAFGAEAVLGTNDNQDLVLKRNNQNMLRLLSTGNTRFEGGLQINDGNTNKLGQIYVEQSAGLMRIRQNDNGNYTGINIDADIEKGVRFDFDGTRLFEFDANGFAGIGLLDPTSAIDTNGAMTMRGMVAPAISAAGQGRVYFDSTSNTFKISQNGSAYADILTSASATGDITEVNAGTGLTGGATSGSATLNVDVGVGANQIVQLNATSQLPAVSGVNLTNLNADNIASGTLPIARGGTGAITAQAAINNLLPTQAAQSGKLLSTDGTNVSWIDAPAGGVTEVTSANAYLSVATGTTTPVLTLNVGTAVNTVAAGDDARITGALQTADYNAQVLPAASCTTSQTSYYNTVAGAWACQNINISGGGGFVNDGNTFGAAATLGTNDTFALNFETDGTTKMTILPAGNVGVGTTSPKSKLEVDGSLTVSSMSGADSSLSANLGIADTTLTVSSTANYPATGIVRVGQELMSYSGKTATTLTGLSRGLYSTPTVTASGGVRVQRLSLAVPTDSSQPSGLMYFGGSQALAIGTPEANAVLGDKSLTVGHNSRASSGYSFAQGDSARATGSNSMASGGAATAIGINSQSFGHTTTADSYAQMSIGQYNLPKGGESANTWVTSDPLFVVGNGTSLGAGRSNAMMILKNGNVGVGATTPASPLTISNDLTVATGNADSVVEINRNYTVSDINTKRGAYLNQNVYGSVNLSGTVGISSNFTNAPGGTALVVSGFGSQAQANGIIGDRRGFTVGNASGTGTINTQYGLYIENLTKGAVNYGVFTAGTTPSSFGGNVGIGNTNPSTALDVSGAFSQRGMAAPALSPAGQGRIYFDSTSNKFRVSQNGGAYTDLIPTGGIGDILQGGNSFAADATIGTNDAYALNFETQGTNKMTILANGNVGIGETNPAQKLRVNGQVRPESIFIYRTSGASNNMIELSTEGGANNSTQRGIYANMDWSSTANAASSTTGSLFELDLYPSGTLGNATGSQVTLNTTSGTVTNAYGFRSSVLQGGSGTVTNAYGLHIASVQGTNKFSIYTTDSTAPVSIASALDQRGMAAPALSPAGQGRIYFDSTSNRYLVSQNGGAYVDLIPNGGAVGGTGTTNAIPKFTAAGAIGDSAIVDNGTTITATRSIASATNPIASGATINLATSNTHTLASIGGPTITVTNPSNGGVYNIVVEDTVSRTYTFSGCTATYFKPANAPTAVGTRTVYGLMTIQKGGNWDCYVTWSTGFQP